MTKNKLFVFFAATVLMIVAGIALTMPKTTEASPALLDTPESMQIQDVIRRSYEIEAIAARTFDTSQFSSVFANSPIGKLSPLTIEFVREAVAVNDELKYLTTKPDSEVGFLDYKLAYYIWWKKDAERFDTLLAVAEKENRDLTEEEAASLVDNTGRVAAPRLDGDATIPDLKFFSVEIDGNVALVVFDDGPRTNLMTLIRDNGLWYIVNWKILDVHP